MSNKSKSVFPLDPIYYNKDAGMTLRDYFAAKAMQALIDNDYIFDNVPEESYKLADAMMEARNV